MIFSAGFKTFIFQLPVIIFAIQMLVVCPSLALGQGAVDYTGTGGSHTIQGRIYFPSGRRADAPGLKVTLESSTSGNLAVFADSNGTFTFKSLTAGSYTIIIDGSEEYGTVREAVYIDDPGSSNIRGRSIVGNAGRILMVPIHLMPKHRSVIKAGVVNAALAEVPREATEYYLNALQMPPQDNKKAIEQLKAAIAIYPKFPLALNELGVRYLKTGQLDKAEDALAKAVAIVPEEPFPRLHYGITLLNQRKFDDAEKELRKVLQKNPVPTAHMYLGIALISQKRLDEAEKELLAAAASNSNDVAMTHRYLGGIYWGKREYARAAEALETYLRLDPKASDAERTREAIKSLRSKQK